MVYINSHGYLEKRVRAGKAVRNWWLPRYTNECLGIAFGIIELEQIHAGKRIRFKVEVIEGEIP